MKKFTRRWSQINADFPNSPFVLTRFFRIFILLFVLSVFACDFFAQNSVSMPDNNEWPVISASLSSQIASGSIEQKREALFQIRNLQTEQASRLAVPALTDSNEIVRATAASSVIFLPEVEAAAVLISLLRDKAEFVRREAAYALGKVGNANAISSLLQTLQKDKILEVRTASAVALGMIGDASAVPALTTILQARPREEDEFLRRSAARSIGQIAQIIRTGKRRVLTPQNFLAEKFKNIESPITGNLIEKYPVFRASISVLVSTLQNKAEADDTRREAAFSLGAIGDDSAISVLRANLTSDDPYLVEISKEALAKLSPSEPPA
ncbi:MAG: HEAT repeat domain-containing protein [Pyrinomonadaceae bacterium]|nr:HEAT repeat domain-containing protein [Blastocatellia bacterium]MDQ3220250.1 HEAT repeat domain-containing protein [Acidobacteriota bacterium]